MLAQYALAWLLTYLLHSTLLLGLAWLASKPLARWSVAAEEAVWKLALVGALLTASLQLAAGWEPAAGRWRLAQVPPAVSATMARTERTERTETTETTDGVRPESKRLTPSVVSVVSVVSMFARSYLVRGVPP